MTPRVNPQFFEARDWALLDRALETAAVAHRAQTRKATGVPYLVHPYAVGMLLLEARCPTEVVIAGILHDVIEDTPVTLAQLRQQFGDEIAEIVAQCSEPDKSWPWEKRKQHTIDFLPTAPLTVKLVMAADKLHNVRSIVEEYHKIGKAVWERFNRGREQQAWYYRNVANSLIENLPNDFDKSLFVQLREEVEFLFSLE